MVVTLLITLLTGWLFTMMPMGFLPTEDTGRIFAVTEAAQGISFEDMKLHQEAVAAIVAKDPNVEGFMSSVGAGGTAGSNTGRLFMRLKPRSERKLSADEIIQELRPQACQGPGNQDLHAEPAPRSRSAAPASKSQYQFTLQSPDTEEPVPLCRRS